MAVHRYWGIRGNTFWGGSNDSQIQEIEFRETFSGPNLATVGNGTASASQTQGGTPASAFDGNTGTFWYGKATPVIISWDFGAGNEKDITWVSIRTQPGIGYPNNFDLIYSDNGSTWTTLYNFNYPNVSATMLAFGMGSGVANLTAPMALVKGSSGSSAYLQIATPGLSFFGGANASLIMPTPSIATLTGGSLSGYLPLPYVAAYAGGFSDLSATYPTLVSSGGPGANIANMSAPYPVLDGYGGARAILLSPMMSASVSGTFTSTGNLASSFPTPTAQASGTVSAVANAVLSAPVMRALGYFGAVASVTLSGKPTVFASGTSGSVGYATITAPLFDLTASATARSHGSAILAAPMPRMATSGAAWLVAPGAQLTAIGTAVVAVTYEAYALNLKHNPAPGQEPVDEMTRYTNYPFDRIVRYKNSYFGMNSTGLYLLEGTTDFAEPTPALVQWDWRTALTDFKSPQLKKLEVVYFGGRMPAAATVTVAVGESGTESYNYTTPRGPTAQNYRQPLGKGMKARYYAVGASGAGDLALDTLTFNVTPLARKV